MESDMHVEMLRKACSGPRWTAFVEDGQAPEVKHVLASPLSAKLSAIMLRKAFPYLFGVMSRGVQQKRFQEINFKNLGQLGTVNKDVLAKIMCFCGEQTISSSLAPACSGLRNFLSSREFVVEMWGGSFVSTFEELYQGEPAHTGALIQVVVEAELTLLSDNLKDVCRRLRYMEEPAPWLNASLASRAHSFSVCLEGRSRIKFWMGKLQQLHLACQSLVQSSSLPALLAHCVQLGSILNGRRVETFSWGSLELIQHLHSRFDAAYTGIHHVMAMVERNACSPETVLQDAHLLRVALEVQGGGAVFRTLEDCRAEIATLLLEAEQIAFSQDEFFAPLKVVASSLKANAHQVKLLTEYCEHAQEELVNTLVGTKQPNGRQVAELLALAKFVERCARVVQDNTFPTLDDFCTRLENAIQAEDAAAEEQRILLSTTTGKTPSSPAFDGIEPGVMRRSRAELTEKFQSAVSRARDQKEKRNAGITKELARLNLCFETHSSKIERMLQKRTGSLPQSTREASKATLDKATEGRQKTRGVVLEDDHTEWGNQPPLPRDVATPNPSPNQSSSSPHKTVLAGDKAESNLEENEQTSCDFKKHNESSSSTHLCKVKTKRWSYTPAQQATPPPIWEKIHHYQIEKLTKCTSRANDLYTRRIFSIGTNIHSTKAVRSGFKKKHFTLADFTGENQASLSNQQVLQPVRFNQGNLQCKTSVQVFSLDELVSFAQSGEYQSYGLDRTALEQYLTNTQFQRAFGLNREAFAKLPGWRRAKLKRERGIF